MRKRADIQRREANAAGDFARAARATTPYYTTIQNTTCLTAPEVVEGPYYVNNELVRTDLRESQTGVTLLLDLGVMDTTSCTPMNNAFVEIWAANALGDYSAYASINSFDGKVSWLRGGYFTDTNGIVELTTIYPGHYTGRAPHIHIMVHKDWVQSSNGTLASHSGTLVHIGQTFFLETTNDEVYKTSPYTDNTSGRTLNSQDQFFSSAFDNGYNAYTSLQYFNGKDISEGFVGYLTVGVDTRTSHTIGNKNYNQNASGSSPNTTGSGGGSNSGSNNGSGNGSSSGAEPQWRVWGNALCLTLVTFAYFGYKHTPARN